MRARMSNALRGAAVQGPSAAHTVLGREDLPILGFAALGLATTLVLLTKALGRMIATACSSQLSVAHGSPWRFCFQPQLVTPALAEPLLPALRVV
jgi:hypothetical protein